MLSEVAFAAGELSGETKPIWSLDQIHPAFVGVHFPKPSRQHRKRGADEIYDQQTEIMQLLDVSPSIMMLSN